MEKFTTHTGVIVPLDIANVDTDQIIPKQFLQKTERVGFADHLFNDWRYINGDGQTINPDFVLNQPMYQGASVLLARENFGCGSSREHAPWSLQEYGFKVIIAPSFADIFYANCINIGVLPIILTSDEIDELFALTQGKAENISIDLPKNTVTFKDKSYTFELDEFQQHCLENGIDAIGWTLTKIDKIQAFEKNMPAWQ